MGLQKEDCLKLRKVIEWNYLHTLTFREAVPFSLVGKLLFQTNKKTSQKMEEEEVKEETRGKGRMLIPGEGGGRGERSGNRHHLLWRDGLMFPFYCCKGLVQKYAQSKHPMNTQQNEKTHHTGYKNIIYCISPFFPLQFD